MAHCSFCPPPRWAQTTTLEGDVKGENGQPLKDAIIKIERLDIKGNYKTKTDKKGHYIHAGLPLGTLQHLGGSRRQGQPTS